MTLKMMKEMDWSPDKQLGAIRFLHPKDYGLQTPLSSGIQRVKAGLRSLCLFFNCCGYHYSKRQNKKVKDNKKWVCKARSEWCGKRLDSLT
uniref:Uncharacterized protein n=1 Tax=Mus musculus TaxID=10090 RepID=Q8CF53_MOUSE|nr:unnamed protein product [Mus musculus]